MAANVVANLFLAADRNSSDAELSVTNMNLEKLHYYTQGYHPERTGHELFPKEVQAWSYSLWVSDGYWRFKYFNSRQTDVETNTEPKPERFTSGRVP